MAFVRVVLPHPLGPTRPKISPRSIRMSMPLSATIPPKRRSTDWHCNTGPALSPAKDKLPPPPRVGRLGLAFEGRPIFLVDYRAKLTNVGFPCKLHGVRRLVDLLEGARIASRGEAGRGGELRLPETRVPVRTICH